LPALEVQRGTVDGLELRGWAGESVLDDAAVVAKDVDCICFALENFMRRASTLLRSSPSTAGNKGISLAEDEAISSALSSVEPLPSSLRRPPISATQPVEFISLGDKDASFPGSSTWT